jgi:hypothetical protein
VKGVGHMAPQWARQPVQDMILSWIHDETFWVHQVRLIILKLSLNKIRISTNHLIIRF